jgi:uncharacterized protein (TIGR02453 family)
MKEVFDFLRDLEAHNQKPWFQENKDRYEAAKSRFEAFVGELIQGLAPFDPEIASVEVKETTYRIYRDVRFSPDKSPYKNHMGAYLVKGGKKSLRGGYYVHVQPGEAFLAGGIWCPDPALLKVLRREVHDRMDEFVSIVQNPRFTDYFALDASNKLKKVPAPFASDTPNADWLKYKSYAVTSPVSEAFFDRSDVVEQCVERFQRLIPLNRFLNEAVDEFLGR